jgi:hypothetical protein
MDNVIDPLFNQHYVFAKNLLKVGAVAIYGTHVCFMSWPKFQEFLK